MRKVRNIRLLKNLKVGKMSNAQVETTKNATVPFSRDKDGNTYTAKQMTKELYAYRLRWRGFVCPIEGCGGNLKWNNCTEREKFWSHKPERNPDGTPKPTAHSGESWDHVNAKAILVDNLDSVAIEAKQCPSCDHSTKYFFDSCTAKCEYTVMEGIRADVAIFKDDKVVGMVSVVQTHKREPEKWQKIYNNLNILLFEVKAADVLDWENGDLKHLSSFISARWELCKACRKEKVRILTRRISEPNLTISDGRHVAELTDYELSDGMGWRAHGKTYGIEPFTTEQSDYALSLTKKRGVCCRCSERCLESEEQLCLPCYEKVHATLCERCGRNTWSSWKQHCSDCYRDIKLEAYHLEERERRQREEERLQEKKLARLQAEAEERKREKEREAQRRQLYYEKEKERDRQEERENERRKERLKKRRKEEAKSAWKETGRTRKVELDDEELAAERNRKRQRAKAQKKRKEEKELKVYKETDAGYQKKINGNRKDFGLPKKKVQKTMANFFVK